jgi:hypothetical protein
VVVNTELASGARAEHGLVLDDLPAEMIVARPKHLSPADFVNLYSTNKSLSAILYKDYKKFKESYLRAKFKEFAVKYLKGKKDITVCAFDYFSENNKVCYDGKTPSFKVL